MSISVRQWSKEELKAISSGKDKMLATIFMNKSTFGEDEIKHYPYNLRREYCATLEGAEEQPIQFYATDFPHAIKFLRMQYRIDEYPIVSLDEITTVITPLISR